MVRGGSGEVFLKLPEQKISKYHLEKMCGKAHFKIYNSIET